MKVFWNAITKNNLRKIVKPKNKRNKNNLYHPFHSFLLLTDNYYLYTKYTYSQFYMKHYKLPDYTNCLMIYLNNWQVCYPYKRRFLHRMKKWKPQYTTVNYYYIKKEFLELFQKILSITNTVQREKGNKLSLPSLLTFLVKKLRPTFCHYRFPQFSCCLYVPTYYPENLCLDTSKYREI